MNQNYKLQFRQMLFRKIPLNYCSSLKPIRELPFKKHNLQYLSETLSIKPEKQILQKIVEESINKIRSSSHQISDQFQKSQKKVDNLYSYIKQNVLKENDSELDQSFHSRAHYYFQKEGKKVRPIMINLLSKTLCHKNEPLLEKNVQKWQALIEIMHIASLAHDDIIDDSPSRRGQQSQHLKYGAKLAVFSGNYIIAKASRTVSDFNSPRLYEIYAYAMDSLAEGQLIQLLAKDKNKFTNSDEQKQSSFQIMMENYMHKTYYKTAALMSNALAGLPTLMEISDIKCKKSLQEECFRIGQHFGLAFQLVDDILDYISTEAQMGKEQMSDLIQGNVTAPVYFTYYHTKEIPKSKGIINLQLLNKRKKNKEQALKVKEWVHQSVGIQLTYLLAIRHVNQALDRLSKLGVSQQNFDGWKYLGYKLLTRRK